jgi:hypothetical protein
MSSSVVKHSLTINARGAADFLQWRGKFIVVRENFFSGTRKFYGRNMERVSKEKEGDF